MVQKVKRLADGQHVEDLNLKKGERFMVGDYMFRYRGIIKHDGKEWDEFVPVKS